MTNKRIAVIGTVFIDCKGFAKQDYRPAGRNLGSIQFVHGGVGRNVAETIASLRVPTTFVSSVDATGIGHEVLSRLQANQIDVRYVKEASSEGMGMWLAILNENGDLAGSISQMPDLAHTEQQLIEQGDAIIAECSHIALELDLNEPISRRVIELAAKHGKPVYGIPGNFDVIGSHPDLLQGMSCFICNHIEGERLMNATFDGATIESIVGSLAAYAHASGLQSIVMTMGEKGAVYFDAATGESGHQPVFPVNVVDTTGAGDAFFSGTVAGLVSGLPLAQAVVCGTKVAGWTIESAESTCTDLTARAAGDAVLGELLG
ncbi:carbohydrate kinase family protein [Paenibacillus sp. MBLB4367]|uniref:carbohydrate kinase family protein n=1 Tax=Paenibacillus sp. MBLB4367 TaxID=3384767 RepID=UPI00390838A9